MKSILIFTFAILLYSILSSCSNNVDQQISTDTFIGTWIESGYENSISVMAKSDSLVQDKYGFTFFAKGEFLERKNAGWCGTPPIAYDNFRGSWIKSCDSVIDIRVAFWGGQDTFSLVISSLTNSVFKYRKVKK